MSAGVRALAALLACVLLAGCSSIPTSGPVERVSAAPGRINSGVEIAPAPPGPDAAPVEIIEGFLHAMAAYEPDYTVARTYLTDEARGRWNPDVGVRVYAEGTPVVVSEQGARLSAPLVGVVDAQGGFTESGGRLDHDFGLVRGADGQWRVSRPPDGIVLSEYLFRSTFVRVPVYFYAAGHPWLLPDPRYFPRGQRALERAVRAVFAGPTPWASAITTVIPAGGRVVAATVTGSGEAEVVVDTDGVPVPSDQLTALATQLTWTLRAFDTVVSVRVRDAVGQPWAVRGFEGRAIPVTPVSFPEADPQWGQTSRQLFGVVGGRLARINEGNLGIESIPIAPAARDVAAAAVRHDGQQAAVVTGRRDELQLVGTSENSAARLLGAAGLRRPHFSRLGELWVAGERGSLYVAAGETVQELHVGDLVGGEVVGLRVSPDAARLLLVVARPDGRRTLGVAGIVRTGGVVDVVGWRGLAIHGVSTDPLDVVDAGWRTSDSLMVLVQDGRGTTVVAVRPDGSEPAVVGPPSVANLVELAVAPGVTPMVRAEDGRVYRYYADYRWSSFAEGLAAICYAG